MFYKLVFESDYVLEAPYNRQSVLDRKLKSLQFAYIDFEHSALCLCMFVLRLSD